MKRMSVLLCAVLLSAILMTFGLPVQASSTPSTPMPPFTVTTDPNQTGGSNFTTIKDAIDAINKLNQDCYLIVNANYTFADGETDVSISTNKVVTIVSNAAGPYALTQDTQGSPHFVLGDNNQLITENVIFNSTKSGGGIVVTGNATLNIKSNTVFDNNGLETDQWGGAIKATESSSVTINSAVFNANKAEWGGAISATGSSSVTINSAVFNANKAKYGGAIYAANQAKVNIANSYFTSNKAQSGGAINVYPQNVELILKGNTFEQNSALGEVGNNGQGGVLKMDALNQFLSEGNIFSNNMSTESGGVAMLGQKEQHSQYIFKNSQFINNRAAYAGAISCFNCTVNFTSCVFSQNSADASGGALIVFNNSNMDCSNGCRFEGNHAGQVGGAIYAADDVFSGVDPLPATAFSNLKTDETTVFKGNYCDSMWYMPPTNAANFTNLGFASVSDLGPGAPSDISSPINNYDIGYIGRLAIVYNSGEMKDDAGKSMVSVDPVESGSAAVIKKPEECGFVQESYEFKYWSTDPNGGNQYMPGDTIDSVENNMTLYAIWEYIPIDNEPAYTPLLTLPPSNLDALRYESIPGRAVVTQAPAPGPDRVDGAQVIAPLAAMKAAQLPATGAAESQIILPMLLTLAGALLIGLTKMR